MKSLREKKNSIFAIFAFLVAIIFYSVTFATVTTYPTDRWQTSTPEKQGMQSQMLADLIEHIKTNNYSIDSVSVIRNGDLVLDAYFYPFSKGSRHNIHSCTKSIMSILIGIAIEKGYIKSVDQSIIDFFPDKRIDNLDDNKRSITLEHLLKMTSGLECRDSYQYEWKGLKEMKESDDWVQHVLKLPMESLPGDKFEYCNGVSYLLSAIISKTTKMKTIDFAKKNLFNPLGISEIFWETSPDGLDVGYSGIYLKPHDMAKIGWLYLNKGRWGKKQLVSSSWVENSTRGHIEAKPNTQYGYQWWVNDDGNYAAVGYGGQYIMVATEMNMVVVFTGSLPGGNISLPFELTMKYIFPAVVSSDSVPENEKEAKRLDNLVKSISIPFQDGFVWSSKEEGLAKDGVFRRTRSPKFMFEYPVGSEKQSTSSPGQIMRMKTPQGVHFSANVIAKPEKLELKDFGPNFYAAILRQVGSDVRIAGNKEIVLKCGTNAYRNDIKWVYQDFYQVNTVAVSSYKNNQCVYLVVHPTVKHEKFARIVKSLTFEKIKLKGQAFEILLAWLSTLNNALSIPP